MPYSNNKYGEKIQKAFVENLYISGYEVGVAPPPPPPGTYFLLDNTGEMLLDNTSEPLLVKG